MKKLLWLDDYRDPFDSETDWMVFSPIGRDVEIHWVKSAEEFELWIINNGLPDGICFDHDLDPSHYAPEERYDDYDVWAKEQNWSEKTGHHCAHWLVDYCLDYNKPLPKWSCQSANPSGRKNIDGLLFSYLKHTMRND